MAPLSSILLFFVVYWFLQESTCESTEIVSIVPILKIQGDAWSRILGPGHQYLNIPGFNSTRIPPIISNLNDFLVLFGFLNCAIHIDNFRHVNLLPKFPIHTRRPVLAAFFRDWDYGYYYPPVAWVRESKIQHVATNITIFDDFRFDGLMQYDKLLQENRNQYKDVPVFLPINFCHHSLHTTSWNCQVQLLLFPPAVNSIRTFPPLMWYPGAAKQLGSQIPSRTPKITIILMDPSCDQDSQSLDRMVLSSNILDDTLNFNQLLLSLRVILNKNSSYNFQLSNPQAMIDKIEVLQFCSICKDNKSTTMKEVGGILRKQTIHKDNLFSLKRRETLAFPDFSQTLPWTISTNQHGWMDNFQSQFKYCGEGISPPLSQTWTFSSHSISEIYSEARARAWMSIVPNSTFSTGSHSYAIICQDGQDWLYRPRKNIRVRMERKLLINSDVHTSLAYPVRMSSKLDSLQFVSCGKRGYHSYPYHEMTNVFDKYIWIFLLLTYLGTLPVILIAFSVQKELWSLQGINLAGWKLLEQSDNTISRCHPCALKSLMWTFILVGVVLSNAYINSNVYKAMSCKEAIPYQRLEQLLTDKFIIFTRIPKLNVKFGEDWVHWSELELDLIRHELKDFNQRAVAAFSEVLALTKMKDTRSNSMQIEKLRGSSKILDMRSWIKTMVQAVIVYQQSNHTDESNLFLPRILYK